MCAKYGSVCTMDYDPDQTGKLERNLRVENGCKQCRDKHRHCNGERPCDKCIERGLECEEFTPRQDGVKFEDKCGTCQSRRRKCNGKSPCDTCLRDNQNCKPQGWQEIPKCDQCFGTQMGCDRQHPCETCKKKGKVCTYVREDGLRIDAAITKKENLTDLEEDNEACNFCTAQSLTCDGGRPCNTCVRRYRPGHPLRWCIYELVDNRQVRYRPDQFQISDDGKVELKEDFTVGNVKHKTTRGKTKKLSRNRQHSTGTNVLAKETAPTMQTTKGPVDDDDEDREPPKTASKRTLRDWNDISEDEEEPLDDFDHLIDEPEGDSSAFSAAAMMVETDFTTLPIPATYQEALRGPEGDLWGPAFDAEYASLLDNDTWTVVELPPGRMALTTRWVLKRKTGADGRVSKYKARLVVRGFQQKEGVDFTEVFASVVKPTTWRVLLAIGVRYEWKTAQFDVVTAFLNGDLEEDIYVRPPPGYPEKRNRVLKLNKALYGLKQAPRQWYEKFKTEMIRLGWRVSAYDPCLFIHDQEGTFLVVYVDDMIVLAPDQKTIDLFKRDLFKVFSMTDQDECKYFLGVHIDRADRSLKIHQKTAIIQILKRYGLEDIPPIKTPIREIPSKNTGERASPEFIKTYISKVGSLNYISQTSRPDITFAASVAGRFNANPNQEHMDNVHRIYAYLKGTMERGIVYSDALELSLEAFVDADWGGCPDTFRSTTGWIVTLGGNPISWSSQRQKTVSLSTTEAEYVAASEAAKEVVWLKGLINDLGTDLQVETVPLRIDNESAMKLTKNAEFHGRTKHINIKHHFVRELVDDGTILPIRVASADNVADVLTKPLSRPIFERHFVTLGSIAPHAFEGCLENDQLSFVHTDESMRPPALDGATQAESRNIEKQAALAVLPDAWLQCRQQDHSVRKSVLIKPAGSGNFASQLISLNQPLSRSELHSDIATYVKNPRLPISLAKNHKMNQEVKVPAGGRVTLNLQHNSSYPESLDPQPTTINLALILSMDPPTTDELHRQVHRREKLAAGPVRDFYRCACGSKVPSTKWPTPDQDDIVDGVYKDHTYCPIPHDGPCNLEDCFIYEKVVKEEQEAVDNLSGIVEESHNNEALGAHDQESGHN